MIRSALLSLALAASLVTAAPAKDLSSEEMATQLIAATTFATAYCPGMTPQLPLLAAALEKMGHPIAMFSQNPRRMAQANQIVAAYQREAVSSCATAWELFGDNGSILPGLLKR